MHDVHDLHTLLFFFAVRTRSTATLKNLTNSSVEIIIEQASICWSPTIQNIVWVICIYQASRIISCTGVTERWELLKLRKIDAFHVPGLIMQLHCHTMAGGIVPSL